MRASPRLTTPGPAHSPCPSNSTPIYALVDCDPDGLEILSVYKYGSRALAHLDDVLAVERITWLGVKTGDWSFVSSFASIQVCGRSTCVDAARTHRATMTSSSLSPSVIARRSAAHIHPLTASLLLMAARSCQITKMIERPEERFPAEWKLVPSSSSQCLFFHSQLTSRLLFTRALCPQARAPHAQRACCQGRD